MANISHFTQTVNGVSTTYDIHDANAVDLASNQTVAGNKEFTGTTTAHDVVPSATDTYNFGSSSAQWKNVSTVLINGKAPAYSTDIPTKVSQLTNDSGFISSEIDSMGEGWVRFKSGLQICYGRVKNISNVATGRTRFSFSMAFNKIPNIVAIPDIEYLYVITAVSESVTSCILSVFVGSNGSLNYTTNGVLVNYVAIGKWK